MSRTLTLPALGLFAVTATLGVLGRPLLPVDETRYLAVAWEMHRDGSLLVPHLEGAIYTHKPPLLFWLINLVWLPGVSETAARLIGPAFGLAAVAATAALGRRLWPEEPGVGGRAALILAGFGAFALYAGLTMFDGMLTAAVALGALALLIARERRAGWVGFGAALALGAYAKGPVILVHLLPLALAMPLWAGVPFRRVLAGLGVALATGLALVGLWLVPALVVGGPEYRAAVLWSQHAGRISGSFAHARPAWFYLAMLPLLLWPWAWSAAALSGLARLDLRGDRGLRFCAIWAGSVLLLFSLISGKQIQYLLPALPAAALLLARAAGGPALRAPLAGILPAALGLAALAAAAGLLTLGDSAELAGPGWLAALAGLCLLGLAVAALRLRGPALALLGPGTLLALTLFLAFGEAGRVYDAGRIAALLAPHAAGGVAVAGRAEYHGEFNFAARLPAPVVRPRDSAAAEAWRAAHPEGALVARIDRPGAPSAPPDAVVAFRDRPYGVWGPAR